MREVTEVIVVAVEKKEPHLQHLPNREADVKAEVQDMMAEDVKQEAQGAKVEAEDMKADGQIFAVKITGALVAQNATDIARSKGG